jgi:hypothetical protein
VERLAEVLADSRFWAGTGIPDLQKTKQECLVLCRNVHFLKFYGRLYLYVCLCLKSGHDHFFLYHFQFIVHRSLCHFSYLVCTAAIAVKHETDMCVCVCVPKGTFTALRKVGFSVKASPSPQAL